MALTEEEVREIVQKDPSILRRLPLLYRRELIRLLDIRVSGKTEGGKSGKGRSSQSIHIEIDSQVYARLVDKTKKNVALQSPRTKPNNPLSEPIDNVWFWEG